MPSSSKMTSGNFRTSSYVLGEGNTIKIHYYRSQPTKSEETEQARRMPILLLHGYPQTSFMWKEVVREMSGQYDLVVPDLRGYGRSSKPKGSETHVEYSKREMANDMVNLMNGLGLECFDVVAHDRGARVAHRLILDHPGSVRRAMLIDIAPTLTTFESMDQDFATGYWHWFFQIMPSPLSENIIKNAGDAYWEAVTHNAKAGNFQFDEGAERMYKTALLTDDSIHATCEDYRAAASIDLEHDRLSRQAGQKIEVQALRIIWGGRGQVEKTFGEKTIQVWKDCCDDKTPVSGEKYDAGHYIPEEKPEQLVKDIINFVS